MRGYGVFATYYDGLTSNVPYPQRAAYFDQLIQTYAPAEGGNLLLDLACGTGSLSVELARMGYDVIGVDGSAEMLAVARQKAASIEGCTAENPMFLWQDMTRLNLYGTIDLAICALDSLNHITSEKALARVLDRVSLFMNPGGLFIFDVNTPYKHRQVLADNTFVYENDEVFCVWQNSLEPDTLTVDFLLDFFVRNGEHYIRESEQFRERAYSHGTICSLLERAGLELVATFAEDSLDPVVETTQRAVYVTRKCGPSSSQLPHSSPEIGDL